jgi:hypothetical protein
MLKNHSRLQEIAEDPALQAGAPASRIMRHGLSEGEALGVRELACAFHERWICPPELG